MKKSKNAYYKSLKKEAHVTYDIGLRFSIMRQLKHISAILLLLSFSMLLYGQPQYGLGNPFSPDANHVPHGWFVGIGGTYLFPVSGSNLAIQTDSNLVYQTNFNPKGKIGFMGEIGGFKSFERGFIHFLDYGFQFAQWAGIETMEGIRTDTSDISFPNLISGEGQIKKQHVSAFINGNHLFPLKKNLHILAAIGFKFNYRLSESMVYNSENLQIINNSKDQFAGVIQTRLGVLIEKKSLIINPAFETNLLNLYQWDGFTSSNKYFQSKFQPIIFSVRVMWWQKKKDRTCPKKGSGKARKGSGILPKGAYK